MNTTEESISIDGIHILFQSKNIPVTDKTQKQVNY